MLLRSTKVRLFLFALIAVYFGLSNGRVVPQQ